MIRVSYQIFLFILLFAPLAFGTVEQWSIMTVEIGVAVAALICLVGLRFSGIEFLKVPGLLPLFLLLVFIVLQMVPLPPLLIKLISPNSWHAYQPVAEITADSTWIPVTLNRKATMLEFFRAGTYALIYILTIQLLRDKALVRKTVVFLVTLGGVIALFGILQQFSSDGKIFWFRSTPDGVPGGPWVYKNHYSSFLECLSPLALCLFLYLRPRADDEMSLRHRLVDFFSSPRSGYHLFAGIAFLLLGTGIFVSLCRGGMVTFFTSMVLLSLMLRKRRKSKGALALWSMIGLVILAVSWYGWKPVEAEFEAGFSDEGEIQESRLQVWSDSFGMIKDYPLFGSGFGTYNDLYPSYKSLQTDLIFDHAHNEFIELMTDGGLVGFSLAAWFIVSITNHGLRMLARRKDNYAVNIGTGVLVGIFAVLVHCVFDFVLHNMAVALYFMMLCGLLVAVVNTRYVHYETASLLPAMPDIYYRGTLSFVSCFLVVVSAVQIGIVMSFFSYKKVSSIYVSRLLSSEKMNEVIAGVERAMNFDPLEGKYLFYRGELAGYRQGSEAALHYYLRAAQKKPMEGAYLQRVAVSLPPEREETTRRLMDIGYKRALNKEDLVLGLVEWLLYKGEREEAGKIIKDRLETDRNFIFKAGPVLNQYQLGRDEVVALLPEQPDVWIRYGAAKEKEGDLDGALFFRKRALDYIDRADEVKPWFFSQLMHFYYRHKQPEKALEILREGISRCPDHAPFHARLGDYYKKNGILYRAVEEYRQAVMLEPGNENYRNKLARLEPEG